MARELDELDRLLTNANNSATSPYSKFYFAYFVLIYFIISHILRMYLH